MSDNADTVASMTDPMWHVEAVALDLPAPNLVAAWRYGPLAIDFRPMVDDDALPWCWMISHVSSGTALVGLMTDMAKAMAAVEDLHRRIDLTGSRPMVQAPPEFVAWLDALRFDWCRSREAIHPLSEVQHRPRLRVVK